MTENFLQLNQDKTQVLVIGPEAHREELSLKLKSLYFNPSEQVDNLGVLLSGQCRDTDPCFYHL